MNNNNIIGFIVILVAILSFGYMARDGLRDFKGKDRTVAVRGLAERDIKSDLAVWTFTLSTADNDLAVAQKRLEKQELALRDFLKAHTIDTEGSLSVIKYDTQDLLAQLYRPEAVDKARYVVAKTLLLRTSDIDKVIDASQDMDDLVKANVPLGQGSQPTYIFTKLNDVKPQMIKDATVNAYEAAKQFAENSGAKVGAIMNASQGIFDIDGRDLIPMIGSEAQVYKKVRVVTMITYKLD